MFQSGWTCGACTWRSSEMTTPQVCRWDSLYSLVENLMEERTEEMPVLALRRFVTLLLPSERSAAAAAPGRGLSSLGDSKKCRSMSTLEKISGS